MMLADLNICFYLINITSVGQETCEPIYISIKWKSITKCHIISKVP